jgi:transposase
MREVGLAYQLTQQFAQMLRTRTGGKLDAWLASVTASPLNEFHPLVKSILKKMSRRIPPSSDGG